MIGSAATGPLNPAFDDFLYAPIGEERNGTTLTVVSALARQDIDPWDHALHLSRLPGHAAVRELTSLIAALPAAAVVRPAPEAIAARLIALLPLPDAVPSAGKSPKSVDADIRLGARRWLPVFLGYLFILLASQWLLAGTHQGAPREQPAPARQEVPCGSGAAVHCGVAGHGVRR